MIYKTSLAIAVAVSLLACVILHEFGKQHLLVWLIATAVLLLTSVFILLALCSVSEPKAGTVAQDSAADGSTDAPPTPSDTLAEDNLPVKMKYAWDWFQYHADQRLKAFNFFLVILGILIVAYGTAMKEGLTNVATAASSSAAPINKSLTPSAPTPARESATSAASTSTNQAPSKASATSSMPAVPTNSTTTNTAAPLGSTVNAAKPNQLTTPALTASTSPPGGAPPSVEAATAAAASYSHYAAVVALCGVVISIAFFMIEIRNVELVDCGRNWLKQLEHELKMWPRHEDDGRKHLAGAIRGLLPRGRSPRKRVITHWYWIRVIYGMAFVGFLFAFTRALCGF